MARRQVAWRLRALCSLTTLERNGLPMKEIRAELRALLSVVAAAKRAANDHEEEPYGLHRALARLSRAGRKGERNG